MTAPLVLIARADLATMDAADHLATTVADVHVLTTADVLLEALFIAAEQLDVRDDEEAEAYGYDGREAALERREQIATLRQTLSDHLKDPR